MINIIQDERSAKLFAAEIMKDVKEMINETKSYDPWLSTKELSQNFPYSATWFRDQINAGNFGKKARNGDCMAKYKDVERYLFKSGL
jgi:hypothetical protein